MGIGATVRKCDQLRKRVRAFGAAEKCRVAALNLRKGGHGG